MAHTNKQVNKGAYVRFLFYFTNINLVNSNIKNAIVRFRIANTLILTCCYCFSFIYWLLNTHTKHTY